LSDVSVCRYSATQRGRPSGPLPAHQENGTMFSELSTRVGAAYIGAVLVLYAAMLIVA
jgi:hypothetical protein